jgi:hypothetical protein
MEINVCNSFDKSALQKDRTMKIHDTIFFSLYYWFHCEETNMTNYEVLLLEEINLLHKWDPIICLVFFFFFFFLINQGHIDHVIWWHTISSHSSLHLMLHRASLIRTHHHNQDFLVLQSREWFLFFLIREYLKGKIWFYTN